MFYYQITCMGYLSYLVRSEEEIHLDSFSHGTFIPCEMLILRKEGMKSWCPSEFRSDAILFKGLITETDMSVLITQMEIGARNAWGMNITEQVHNLKHDFKSELEKVKPLLEQYYVFSDKVSKNPIDGLIEKYN